MLGKPADQPHWLHVSHAWGGGILRHLDDLSRRGHDIVTPIWLRISDHDFELQFPGRESANIRIDRTGGGPALAEAVKPFAPRRVHLHNLHTAADDIQRLVADLAVPVDVTLHDFHLFSPSAHLADDSGRFSTTFLAMGDPETAPAEVAAILRWQERHRWALDQADRIIAPSAAAAALAKQMSPDIADRVIVAWHPEPDLPEATVATRQQRLAVEPVRVLILGNVQMIKGWRLAADVAAHCRANAHPIDFLWVGLNIEKARATFAPNFRNYGGYDTEDGAAVAARYAPHIVWFPSQVPETYCYALSEALRLARPIVTSDLGAFPERLAGRAMSGIVPFDAPVEDWLAAFDRVLSGDATAHSDMIAVARHAGEQRRFYDVGYFNPGDSRPRRDGSA